MMLSLYLRNDIAPLRDLYFPTYDQLQLLEVERFSTLPSLAVGGGNYQIFIVFSSTQGYCNRLAWLGNI